MTARKPKRPRHAESLLGGRCVTCCALWPCPDAQQAAVVSRRPRKPGPLYFKPFHELVAVAPKGRACAEVLGKVCDKRRVFALENWLRLWRAWHEWEGGK